jgi:hypothetical protein
MPLLTLDPVLAMYKGNLGGEKMVPAFTPVPIDAAEFIVVEGHV